MRIISGKFKGKKIILPKDIQTRPLKDLTKESILYGDSLAGTALRYFQSVPIKNEII